MLQPTCRLLFLSSILLLNAQSSLAVNCDSHDVPVSRLELVEILRRDGFSGVLDEYADLKPFGWLKAGDACFVLVVYETAFRTPGGNVHGAMRLLVIRDYSYLGMYDIYDYERPARIRGNTVEFPGPKFSGNSITFTKNGPPDKVFLHGRTRELFK
jgi:hypothetical protein